MISSTSQLFEDNTISPPHLSSFELSENKYKAERFKFQNVINKFHTIQRILATPLGVSKTKISHQPSELDVETYKKQIENMPEADKLDLLKDLLNPSFHSSTSV